MSKTYSFKLDFQKVNFSLGYLQDLVQQKLGTDNIMKLDLFKNEFGGRFFIEGKSSRGIEVYLENTKPQPKSIDATNEKEFKAFLKSKKFVIRAAVLSNEFDYLICENIITVLVENFNLSIRAEEDEMTLDSISSIKSYFLPERITIERKIECNVIASMIKKIRDTMRFDGVKEPAYFGINFIEQNKTDNPMDDKLLQAFDDVMNKIQWGLPDYVKPSPAAIDKKDGSKPIMIRIMFSGMDYILNDYEYLLLGDNAANDEVIFIDNNDLKTIIKELNLPWKTPDSFTVIAPKLSITEWNRFVEAAKRFNKKEEIDKTKHFIFEVKDVFKLNVFDVLVGKGNIPMYKGKIHCGNTELEVTPIQDNDYTHLENLSFFVRKGKADKKMIGKIFMEKIST